MFNLSHHKWFLLRFTLFLCFLSSRHLSNFSFYWAEVEGDFLFGFLQERIIISNLNNPKTFKHKLVYSCETDKRKTRLTLRYKRQPSVNLFLSLSKRITHMTCNCIIYTLVHNRTERKTHVWLARFFSSAVVKRTQPDSKRIIRSSFLPRTLRESHNSTFTDCDQMKIISLFAFFNSDLLPIYENGGLAILLTLVVTMYCYMNICNHEQWLMFKYTLPAVLVSISLFVVSDTFSSTSGDRGILLRLETSSILERWRFSLARWALTFRFVDAPNLPRHL